MRLQDFLGTDLKYSIQQISQDDELSRQIQSRLVDLGLLDSPVDGLFGPKSTAAFQKFQELVNLVQLWDLDAQIAKKLIETRREDLTPSTPKASVRLQNFVGTDLKYDVAQIDNDLELSRQIQIRLINLGLLDPPADGILAKSQPQHCTSFRSICDARNLDISGRKPPKN